MFYLLWLSTDRFCYQIAIFRGARNLVPFKHFPFRKTHSIFDAHFLARVVEW
jgi:hypothetical protein